MSFSDDVFGKIFPTRTGGSIGASAENRMLDVVGGANGIRTKIQINPDGSTTMLRTRGGAPEFTTKQPYVKPPDTPVEPKPDRTFLFRVFEYSAGGVLKASILANRKGSGMNIIATDVESSSDSCYNVSASQSADGIYKTVNNTTWKDVWRIYNKKVMINGHAATTVQETTTARYGPGHIPYVHQFGGQYISINTTAPLQSLVYVGGNTGAFFGVCAVKKDGGETTKVAPTAVGTSFAPRTGMIAGLSIDSTGVYRFYGNQLNFSVYDSFDNNYQSLKLFWSKIATSRASPYVTETAHGEELFDPMGKAVGVSPSIQDAVTISSTTIPDPPLGSAGGSITDLSETVVTLCNYAQSEPDVPYAFIGSDIEMRLSKTLVHNYSKRWCRVDKPITFDVTTYSPFTEVCTTTSTTWRAAYSDHFESYGESLSSTTTMALDAKGLKRLFSLDATVVDGLYVPGYMGGTVNAVRDTTPCGYTYSIVPVLVPWPFGTPAEDAYSSAVINTRDYVYADMEEEVFITFETIITASGLQNDGLITAKYVLSIRGVDHEFPVSVGSIPGSIDLYHGSVDGKNWGLYAEPLIKVQVSGGTTTYNPAGTYYAGYKPPPIFNPLFMHQGNCPHIAYTTKAEELAGATPEFYLDMELVPRPYINTVGGTEVAKYSKTYTFTPAQFHKAYYKMVSIETTVDTGTPGGDWLRANGAALDGSGLPWDKYLFPYPGTGVTRLQFCNGVKGAWSSKLGATFSNPDDRVDISRI